MPLTLITGPANAAKAGAVLERLRAARAREPVLVVPTRADVDHYQRELAAAGLVFGVHVLTFAALVRAVGRAAGVGGRMVGRVARGRVIAACLRDVPLRALAASARSPGFTKALEDLFAELQRALVGPGRLAAAVRAWEAAGEAPAHAAELAALYSAYHARLEGLGVRDAEGAAHAALDALRREPAAWPERPVFLYGFDDLTPAQLDAVEVLARRVDVCVTLPYEAGRAALAGTAATVELLKPLAREIVVLPERSEHYAAPARGALHHLERGLFEPAAGRAEPNGAVRLLEAGGERAEAELVGASILELERDGLAVEDVAVLTRGDRALVAQVLEGYGIPVAGEQRTRLDRTRLGAGLLAFARAALGTGTAADVLTWLRTPGKLVNATLPDALEATVRRQEARTAADARRVLTRHFAEHPAARAALAALDGLAAAAAAAPETAAAQAPLPADAFLAALLAEAEAIWTATHRRAGAVLDGDGEVDARVAAELRASTDELRALGPELAGGPAELLAALADLEIRDVAASAPAGGVLLAEPLAIRARRFRAVFVCGLQDGELPRRPVPEPFLDDDARASLARASGLVLPRREDVLARERSLFYACVSRPEEVLFLSFRSADEEGEPLQPSPFVEDVRALFTDELWTGRGRRLLAEVTWSPRQAPTPHELRRALAEREQRPDPAPLAAPATAAVRELLAARRQEPARGLETFAACGVRWLIEQLLRPQPVEPDPEPLRRGSLAHAVLERTLRGLRDHTGSARLAPETLPAALAELGSALAELSCTRAGAQARAAARALEVDLERYLRHEAETGAGYEPAWLEWAFGADADAPPIAAGGLAVSGRVDRIDVGAAGALVRDYKGKTVWAGARWADEGRLQVALYALAAREHLGLDVAGALYQPLGAGDQRPRGIVRDDVPGAYVNGDRVAPEVFEARLEEARALAERAAADLSTGRIVACPARCGPQGCRHPGICRAA